MRALVLLGSCLMMIGCASSVEETGSSDEGTDGIHTVTEAISCAPYVPLNGRPTITLPNKAPPTIAADRSLVITNRAGYAAVMPQFTLGKLLEDDASFINYHVCQDRSGTALKDVSKFVRFPFQAGKKDVDDHNAWMQVKVGTVPTIRNTFQTRILTPWAAADEDGPFRLLAVVNRLDLVGDEDLRGGGQFAGNDRRWFGEGRLVFGLTQDVDGSTPYPMTLIMEYRLPALKETVVASGIKYEIDTSFDYTAGPAGNAAWSDGRARWAKIWRELSRYPQTDSRYQALLLSIVQMFATGDNHLALRTGEKVFSSSTGAFTTEFEYREFYLNAQWDLTTRKLRREPILCAQGSTTLQNRIAAEWNTPANDFHYDFMLGDRELTQPEVDELSALCGNNQYTSPNGLPYGQDLNSGGFGLRAKFTRFKSDTVWTIDNVVEAQRHKTAAATCSGCHSTETGNSTIFHVNPRLDGADSQVSLFLTGPVTVTPKGTQYTLNELLDRGTRLAKLAQGYDYSLDYPANHTNEQLYCNANPCSLTTYP